MSIQDDLAFISPASIQTNMNKIPSRRVLSSKTRLTILTYDGEEIDLGEIQNFKLSTDFKVVKKFKPFGYMHNLTLKETDGWSISASFNKIDWNLAYFVYLNEKSLEGTTNSNRPNPIYTGESYLDGDMGALYNSPLFQIRREVCHYNGLVEAYIYKDVTLLSNSEEDPENNGIITQSITAFSPYREIDPNSHMSMLASPNTGKINSKTKSTIQMMLESNKS